MNPSNLSRQPAVDVSIVIPVLNEQKNIQPLLDRIRQNVDGLDLSYEIIFIDDGSRDGTWGEIARQAKNDQRVRGLSLSRNFGHQHALLAGFTFAAGRAIVSMDGDLQHPPSLIPAMIREWREGRWIVQTKRISHQKTSLLKRATSKYYYRFFSLLSNVPIPEGSSDFRLVDRQVLEHIVKFNDLEFFFRGIVNWIGFPRTTLPYQEEPRLSHQSHYSIFQMFRFAVSGIIAFSAVPLKIGIWLGLATSLLAFSEIVYVLVQHSHGITVPGWASLAGLTSFLFGILFILLGCIGLYIANIHESLKNRPRFIVYDKINFG